MLPTTDQYGQIKTQSQMSQQQPNASQQQASIIEAQRRAVAMQQNSGQPSNMYYTQPAGGVYSVVPNSAIATHSSIQQHQRRVCFIC